MNGTSHSHIMERDIYNIHGSDIMEHTTDSIQYIEIKDWNLNSPNSVSDFRLEVNDHNNYYLYSKAFIECNFQILTGSPPVPIAAGTNVGLQNNGVGLFSAYELWLGDVLIERVDQADICNTIQSLIYMDKDYVQS